MLGHFRSSERNLSQPTPRESFEGIFVFLENYDRAIYAVRSSGKFTAKLARKGNSKIFSSPWLEPLPRKFPRAGTFSETTSFPSQNERCGKSKEKNEERFCIARALRSSLRFFI